MGDHRHEFDVFTGLVLSREFGQPARPTSKVAETVLTARIFKDLLRVQLRLDDAANLSTRLHLIATCQHRHSRTSGPNHDSRCGYHSPSAKNQGLNFLGYHTLDDRQLFGKVNAQISEHPAGLIRQPPVRKISRRREQGLFLSSQI
jgi:hypothetical protein